MHLLFKIFNIISSHVILSFTDEPGKPGTPEVVDYDTDFVELQWNRPEEDGGSPITGYIIEKRDKYSPTWEKCAEVDGDTNRGRVNDLVEGTPYEFRVRAVNKAGPGEPSEASKSHTARPKNRKHHEQLIKFCIFKKVELFQIISNFILFVIFSET